MDLAEIGTILRESLPFWGNLDEEERAQLIGGASVRVYQKGENVHGYACECVGVLLLRSGSLRVYMLSEEGRDVTLFRLQRGDTCILSASCVLSSITFEVLIDAELETEVLILSSPLFSSLAARNIYVENYAYKLASKWLSESMWAVQQILFMSLDKRLARFLLDEAQKRGSEQLTLTHEQLARLVGSAREAVSRMLKYFEGEGIVRLKRGMIELTNIDKLCVVAEYC